MKKLMIAVGAALVAGATLAASSFAYQGMLRDEHGAVKQGLTEAIINFRLYLSPTENEVKWGRRVTVSLATNGLFNVELSDSAGTALVENANLDDVIATATKQGFPLYLGLEVDKSAGEIRPRQKLTPAPLATFAQNVAEAKGNFTIAGDAIVSGNLTLSDSAKSLTVKGKAEINALTVSGESTFENKAEFKNGIEVASPASATFATVSASGDASVGGTLSAETLSATTLNATTVKQGGNALIPRGVIVMWSGTTAPAGWALCNGSDGTPDLSGRFIVGYNPNDGDYGFNKVGNTGGAYYVKLTSGQMPSHQHNVTANQSWDRVGVDLDKGQVFISTPNYQYLYGSTDGYIKSNAGSFSLNINSSWAGNNEYHENRPPYYVLAYIMKL